MTKSESIKDLATSLSKAQGEIKNISKDGHNDYYNSDYATLGTVRDAVRDIFAKHGLSVIQLPALDSKLTTILLHDSGEFVEETMDVSPVEVYDKDKQGNHIGESYVTPQGLGSAITYARRYSLMGVAQIAPKDDDGEAAMARTDDHREHSARAASKNQSKSTGETPRAQEGPSNWKTLEVHFGIKLKGLQVGSLKNDQLKWLNEEWNPGENPKYPITAKDKALKEAVLKEMESRNIDQSPESEKPEDNLGWGNP